MSHFTVNFDGTIENEKIFVCNRMLDKLGEIYPVENLNVSINLNSNDEVSFRVYKETNGEINHLWNKIDDIRIVLVESKGYFEITTPKTEEDAIYKDVHGISLGEAETSQSHITMSFNSEDDTNWDQTSNNEKENYKNTILYNKYDKSVSMLHKILAKMPHYSIGHVDASVAILQRTFDFNNVSVYDALQQIAEELECIFIFDNFSRTINCYDLKDHCGNNDCITERKHRNIKNGVCQHCNSSSNIIYGYGKDSGVVIDSANLADTITLNSNKDEVKNTFKIVGGDDVITNEIGMRLMDGDRITKFSDYQLSQMSYQLRHALSQHAKLVQSYQSRYNSLWDSYNEKTEKIIYYKSGMMPGLSTNDKKAKDLHNDAFGVKGIIKYAFKTSNSQTGDSILRSVKTQYKSTLPKEYDVEMDLINYTSSSNSLTFDCNTYVKKAYRDENEDDYDKYTQRVTLQVKNANNMYYQNNKTIFTTEYYLFLKNKLETDLRKSDVNDDVISFDPPVSDNNNSYNPSTYANYDQESNPDNLTNIHYTMYCIERLESFKNAYSTCSSFIAKLNGDISSDNVNILKYITSDGGVSNIYEDLLEKYNKYVSCIDARVKYLTNSVNELEKQLNIITKEIKQIKNTCNLKNYIINNLGEEYWHELCSFIREDTYTNNNFFAEGLDQKEIIKNIELLLERANEEIEKACEIKYSISTTLDNLLVMPEFEPLWNNFSVGNYIRCIIDDFPYRLRLISIKYDYEDVSHIEVEFSTTTKSESIINDIKDVISQASSISTNFSSVARQAEKGKMTNVEFNAMKQYGLDVANMMILNSGVGEYTLDEFGFTGKVWDDDKDDYGDEQIRIINNLLCFTSDAWKHTRLALGKIIYYNDDTGQYEWAYGLNAEVLISNLILSQYLKIYNKSGTMSMTDEGFILENKDKKIKLVPNQPSMVFTIGKKNGQDINILEFNTEAHPDTLWLSGTLDACEINGGTIIGGILKSETWGNGDIDHCAATNGSYIDLKNIQWRLVGNGNENTIFSFNKDVPNGLYMKGKIEAGEIVSGEMVSGTIRSYSWKSNDIESPPTADKENLNVIKNSMFIDLEKCKMSIRGSEPDESDRYKGKLIFDFNNEEPNALIVGKISNFEEIIGKYNSKITQTYNGKKTTFSAHELKTIVNFGDSDRDVVCFSLNTDGDQTSLPGGIGSNVFNPNAYVDNDNYKNGLLANLGWCLFNAKGEFKAQAHDIRFSLYNDNQLADDFLYEVGLYRGGSAGIGVIGSFSPSPASDGKVNLGHGNQLWQDIYAYNTQIQTSDRNKKKDINDLDEDKNIEFINGLKPKSYKFNNGTSNRTHYGMIAQDIEELLNEMHLSSTDFAGFVKFENSKWDGENPDTEYEYGLRYGEFIAPLIKYSQSMYEKIEKQQEIIEKQSKEIEDLKSEFQELKNMIQAAI